MKSDTTKTFNHEREELTPYGLTCEVWEPNLMLKPDRHNEIELNYFPEGNITYLIHGNRITVPKQKLAIFWGLVPHQIVDFEDSKQYYVCTIPFAQFLSWELPQAFLDDIFNGKIVLEKDSNNCILDEFYLSRWIEDLKNDNNKELILLEMKARLTRLSFNYTSVKKTKDIPNQKGTINSVEKIAIYIAANYQKKINASEVAKSVGLHPDYANSLFKKAFDISISEQIITERISHAKRKLLTTNLRVSEIAFDCGFTSISNFNQAFLKTNNCTPREFRIKKQ